MDAAAPPCDHGPVSTPSPNPSPVRSRPARRRALANRLNLTTLLGRAIARAGGARLRRGPDGLWLGEGYRLPFPAAGAFTVGDVVITAATFAELERRTPGVLGHEARHAAQYARWGVGFFPLYGLAAGWSWLWYRDPALGNPFERGAGLVSGAYLAPDADLPPRLPWAAALGLIRRSPGRGAAGRSDPPGGGTAGGAAA